MADSFDTASPKTPTAVTSMQIVLDVYDGTPNQYAASYRFVVKDADGGDLELRQGNLVPHLTAAQINAAKSFMDSMLTKAQGVIS